MEDAPLMYDMFLHPAGFDGIISQSLKFEHGNYGFENWLKREFYQYLHPNATSGLPRPSEALILDVGANIGLHTFFFAALGMNVHAFEPNPMNYQLLQCSKEVNPDLMLTVHPYGLSNVTTKGVCMDADLGNLGHSYVRSERQTSLSIGSYTTKPCKASVKLRTLDDVWIDELKEQWVYMMKIDVEGYEPLVLDGGRRMFKEKPPLVIFLEVSPDASEDYGLSTTRMLSELMKMGYELNIVTEGKQRRIVSVDEPFFRAYLQDGRDHITDVKLIHLPTLKRIQRGELKL
jgi:FkbM family methyltransferase